MDNAITGNMAHLMAAVKAVKRFKSRVSERRGQFVDGILGRDSRLTAPPHAMRYQTRSQDTHDRRPLGRILVTSGVNSGIEVNDDMEAVPPDMENLTMVASPEGEDDADLEGRLGETEAHYKQRLETLKHHPSGGSRSATETRTGDDLEQSFKRRSRTFPVDGHLKGHAHDPLEDTLFLNIGHDPSVLQTHDMMDYPMVSESPPAVEMDIYEQAYQEEMEKILARRPREPSMYMTRRVEHRDDIRALSNIKDAGKYAARQAAANFERFSNKAYATGRPVAESGKSYAKSAGGKVSEGWTSGSAYAAPYLQSGKEYLEPWKQSAKGVASRAQEKLGALYNRGGGTGEGISGLVARAQAKAKGETAAPSAAESDKTESTATTEEVAEKANADVAVMQGPEAPETSRATSEGTKPSAGSKPLGGPLGTSVFKEHI
jgi:hypothetical protein